MSDRLLQLFAEGLNVTSEMLNDDTSPENTSEWDSLAAMNLVALLEETFRVEFSTVEIMRMRSIGLVRRLLRSKGVADV